MKVVKIEKVPGTHRVYNIETEKNNNYFANGALVHNCFAYFFKSNNPAIKNLQLRPVDIDRMINALNGRCTDQHSKMMYDHFYSKKFLLHWGGMADPFCHFEKTNRRGLPLIEELGRLNYPTLFSYKGPTIMDPDYVSVFKKYAHQKNFAFQCSIITSNEKLSKKIEIGVPTPTKRIESLKMLSDMGYWTILRLRPFIIGVSDDGLDELLERSLEAGIRGVSTEFFAMDCRSNTGMKERYASIAKIIGVDDLHKYYAKLSPSERGGYMRLNRHVKERHVRKMYEFCIKHGLVFACSDPDFKELNTSGSCCGMPDDFPDNRGLENWTRSQLTYHLKEARKEYHTTGRQRVLTFGGVYGNESYLDEKKFAADHVGAVGKSTAERSQMSQRTIVQKQWNNLKSPACPRNYFHGKLMPTGTDEEGNLMFIYTPSEYEARWLAEGVDLTK
jgi:DNA repair photolyase